MKVCLVRPPLIISPVVFSASITPPIGLAYIAGSLRQAGHEVVLIDGIGENPLQDTVIDQHLLFRGLTFAEIIARIPADADLIGIAGMFSSDWVHIRELVNKIGDAFPTHALVAGGEHFTAASDISMAQCPRLLACVLGEGEETMVEVANTLARGGDIRSVTGLAIRGENNSITFTGPRARIREIDAITPPAWDLVPMSNYLDNNLSHGVNRGRSIPMLASRGCPYQCTFCSNPTMWTTRWLARDPQCVVDEIEDYIKKYRITNVDFFDLTTIVKRGWIVEFCQELINRKLNITWQLPSGTRSEVIDSEVAQLLFSSGCRNLTYAPESGSGETLNLIKKRVHLPAMFQSVKDAVGKNINIKFNIIIGLPDETHWNVWVTLWFLVGMSWRGAHDCAIGVFAPYPGSELYTRLVREGRITHSDEYFNTLAYVDISKTVSYTKHISSEWLRFYNWLGFVIFYSCNYLFRPHRFVRSMLNLLNGTHESRGEMALSSLLGRMKLMPATK